MLNPLGMVQAFVDIATDFPKTQRESAHRYAQAYDTYARSAQALGTLPLFTGLEVKALEEILFAAMSIPIGTPPTMAAAWGAGVVAYWNAPPVTFSGAAQVGAVLQAATAAGVIIPALTAVFLVPTNTKFTSALEIATSLDLGTRTVTVGLAPPSGTVTPLL